MQKNVCLVIPCFEEAERLRRSGWPSSEAISFIFVDDGSQDETTSMIQRLAQPGDQVIRLEKNVGKAEAVRQGALHALSSGEKYEWIGYWDADLATPLGEIEDFISTSRAYPSANAIWGSRIYRCGAKIERSFVRHVLGRAFATVAKVYLGLETYDSQCGAKIFSRALSAQIFEQAFLSRWLFDVEIYFRVKDAHGEIVEHPLRVWRDVPGGKLKIGTTAMRTLIDLFKIKRRYG